MSSASIAQRFVKISEYQDSWYVECLSDGSVRERPTREWWTVGGGTWAGDSAHGAVDIGPYHLVFAHEPDAAGVERWDHDPDMRIRFVVLPLISRVGDAELARHRIGLVKFTGGDVRARIAELQPDKTVVEWDLWSDERQSGRWWLEGEALHVVIDDQYHWIGDFSDHSGFYLGRESGPFGQHQIPGALVRLPHVDPSFVAPSSGPTDAVLFTHGGWEFRKLLGSSGAFAEVLAASKPGPYGEMRWAAKCFRPGLDVAAEREIRILRRVGGKSGIIVLGDQLRLPDEKSFEPYAGSIVQLVELYDTDLAQHIQVNGKMTSTDIFRLAVLMAEAAVELHDHYHVLHNDIRPANIVGRPKDGDWKLADFSVANHYNPATGRGDMPGHSEVSLSPSLVEDRAKADSPDRWMPQSRPADDIWAIGVTLLQAASGEVFTRKPVTASKAATLIARTSPNVRAVLTGCLQADERQRWTAQMLRQEATRIKTYLLEYGDVDKGP